MQYTRLRLPGSLLSALALATLVLSCRSAPQRVDSPPPAGEAVPTYTEWPAVRSALPREQAMEERIAAMVAGMSLREKVGQMTQPEIKGITPDEVRRYYIGSVLNGGGTWPGGRKQSGARDWALLADAYWQASMSTDSKVKIPIIWGTDAVHGHANIYGATLFPHNIGLGAAHEPELVRRIAAATAIQVTASGLDWSFAPVVAVVRDDRWGRTYEGYSEHPALVRACARAFVQGLQGDPSRPVRVVATAKHFLGDGGTHQGRDQGENRSSPAELINLHGQGYYAALEAGAQTVMASFNSWVHAPLGIHEGKVHGSRLLLTEVLKQKLGFDGFVVSDWNGIGQVPGCTRTRCAQAINAGIDMVMVPEDWKQFIEDTVQLVEQGEIPLARVDDAVTRILRVKMRMGLFQAPRPLERPGAGDESRLVHRELAREAVRKSLVLLKNNGHVLPLARGRRLLVVGKSASSLVNQTGGWSLTWQGTGNTNADFPHGDTILAGIQEAAGEALVTYSPRAEGVEVADYSAVIAVIGETPYAEGVGDLGRMGTLELGRRFPEDLAVLEAVQGKGVPVITVLVTGRPLWVNKELNRSDAFVVAWLPGTEGKGVADVLFHKADFQGRLSFSWPRSACQTAVNHGDADHEPLFPLGYGLSYADTVHMGRLDETAPTAGCGQEDLSSAGKATAELEIFRRTDKAPYVLRISSPENWGGVAFGDELSVAHANIKGETVQVNVQGDGKRVTWTDHGQLYAQAPQASNRQDYLNANGALVFDMVIHQAPAGEVLLRVDCQWPCVGKVEATRLFRSLEPGKRHTVKIPLQCFAAKGTDFTTVDTPFLVTTQAPFSASFADIRWVPGAAQDEDATRCEQLVAPD